MKKVIIVVSIVVVCVIGFFIFNSQQEGAKVVKIGYANNIGFLPVHIAKEKELFAKQGLQVELVEMQSAQQLYEALVRNELDYVPFLSTVVVMNGEAIKSGNVKLVTVSNISTDNQFDELLVKKDSSLSSLKELEGKKVGVFPGTTGMNFLKKYLVAKDIDVSKVEFVQLPPANQLQALEAGSILALHAYEPNVTIAVEKFGMKRLANESIFASQINHAAFGGYWVSDDFALAYPKQVKEMIKVMDEANAVISTDEVTARTIAEKVYKLDPVVAQKIELIKMVPSAEFTPKSFTSFTDFLVSIGELKTIPDTSALFLR